MANDLRRGPPQRNLLISNGLQKMQYKNHANFSAKNN